MFPIFLGDIDEKTLNKISNTTKKYKTARKEKAGPMLNRTRRMLRNYFREPMKKLSSLLKDEKYTWADVYSGQDWMLLIVLFCCIYIFLRNMTQIFFYKIAFLLTIVLYLFSP